MGASTGRCKEDETKRPKPKEKIIEEGVHPHPGPPAMDESTDRNAHQNTRDKRKSLWETSESEDQGNRDERDPKRRAGNREGDNKQSDGGKGTTVGNILKEHPRPPLRKI